MASPNNLKLKLNKVELSLLKKSPRTSEENELLKEVQELSKELNTGLLTELSEIDEFKTRTKRFGMTGGEICPTCKRAY